MKKFVNISLYNAEKYHKNKLDGKDRWMANDHVRIDVSDKTDMEINEIVRKLKEDRRRKNKEFKDSIKKGMDNSRVVGIDNNNEKGNHISLSFDSSTGNTFVLFGSSKSGKSTLMMEIYNKWFSSFKSVDSQKMLLTTLFAMNPQIDVYNNGPLSKYIIKSDKFDDNCSTYIDWQRKVNKDNGNKFYFLNMFDDFIDIRYNRLINNLILTYRNSNMSAIICLQYVKLLSKSARNNVNNIILMYLNTDEAIDDCIKSYLLGTIKRNGLTNDPISWYRDMTRDHNYIHINPLNNFIFFSKTGEMKDL